VILVDSSSWIHFLRPSGDPVVRARVGAALANGEACWCPLVRLELWNGASGDRDRRILRDFEDVLPELVIDDEVWTTAYELARRARAAGVSAPATDVLIAACARRHGAEVETADSDFERLAAVAPIEIYTPERIAQFTREAEVDPDTRAAARDVLKRTDD
jgi:predicted nucleic acid-binding protein